MSLTQMSFHPNESTFKPFFWTLNNNSKAPQVTTYMQSSFYPKSHSQCARRPVATADRRSSPGTAPNMQCMYTTVSSLSVQEQADYHVPKLVPGKFSNEKKQRPRVSTPVLQAAHFFYYSSQKLSLCTLSWRGAGSGGCPYCTAEVCRRGRPLSIVDKKSGY